MVKLNLGCGFDIRKDYINCDIDDRRSGLWKKLDLILDLERPLPFKNEVADFIYCSNVCEHLRNFTDFMLEAHRVLKSLSIIEIHVPLFPCVASLADPEHVRFFIPETFEMFGNPYKLVTNNYKGIGLFDIVFTETNEYTKHFTEVMVKMKKVNLDYWKPIV